MNKVKEKLARDWMANDLVSAHPIRELVSELEKERDALRAALEEIERLDSKDRGSDGHCRAVAAAALANLK